MFVLICTEVDGMAELNLVIPMRKGKKIEDNLVFYKEVVNYPKELVWGEGESWHAQFL